jgi:hypothetical protein
MAEVTPPLLMLLIAITSLGMTLFVYLWRRSMAERSVLRERISMLENDRNDAQSRLRALEHKLGFYDHLKINPCGEVPLPQTPGQVVGQIGGPIPGPFQQALAGYAHQPAKPDDDIDARMRAAIAAVGPRQMSAADLAQLSNLGLVSDQTLLAEIFEGGPIALTQDEEATIAEIFEPEPESILD